MRIGAVETGGTKMVMALADDKLNILKRDSIPTRTPEETMPRIIDFFRGTDVRALGLGSFGPLNLDAQSPTYGSITATPKLDWRGFPLLRTLSDALGVPCLIDTDVNAAALSEAAFGAAKGLKSCAYVTVGTGIGVGLYAEGQLIHGAMHPEGGHILLAPHKDDPAPQGFCPYHAGCLEGLAAGPSIEKRWGKPGRDLPDDHIAWEIEAHYLAELCVTLFCTVSPQKILLGGGVMAKTALFPIIRRKTLELLNGYLGFVREDTIDQLITPPALYPDSGLMGALLLGRQALGDAL